MRNFNSKQFDLLQAFNNQVLACQDDAFALAYLLLPNVERASDLVQKFFVHAYQDTADFADSIRPRVFREIIELNHDRSQSERPCSMGIYDDPLMLALQQLAYEERCIAILIDIMNLKYPDVAHIMGISLRCVRRLIAQARIEIWNRVKVMGGIMAEGT